MQEAFEERAQRRTEYALSGNIYFYISDRFGPADIHQYQLSTEPPRTSFHWERWVKQGNRR